MRSPAGSQSGSSAIWPPTHSPKISTSTARPGSDAPGRDVGVRDRALDRVAVAAARHPAEDLAVHPHGLGAERNRARLVEDEAGESPLRRLFLRREERVAPEEVALVELDGEAEAGLERRLVRRDVGAPDAVALLEPQRVDRLVAARDEAVPRPASQSVSQRRPPNSVGQ